MKYFFYILFFCLSFSAISQDSLCKIKIEDTTHSFGIRFKIFTPCNWFKGPRDRNVIKLAYRTKDTAFVCMLSVKDLGYFLKKDDIDQLFNQRYIQEEGFKKGLIPGELVSVSRGKIKGNEGGEMIIKDFVERNGVRYCLYILQSIIVFKDKEIILSYGVGGETETLARESLEKYKSTFRNWANKIEFTSNKYDTNF
jgi:hypothetical protein